MTKAQALAEFFKSFGIDSFPTSTDTETKDHVFPWMTYEFKVGGFGEQVPITVNLWYRTESEKIPNDKAEEIYKAIGEGGVMLTCDDGAIWVKRGEPWCQSLGDTADPLIKRRYINITLEYLTI